MTSNFDPTNAPKEPELPTPENFNLDAFVRGMRPTVRTTNVYGRADLIGEIDSLETQLGIAEAAARDSEHSMEDADEAEELRERIVALQQEFVASGVTFKVGGRSETWLAGIEKEWKNHSTTNGLTTDEKHVFVQLHQLAGAIIEPAGVTYDHLTEMREISEPQIRKLLVTFAMANNQAPQVSVPFSQRSSDKNRARKR